MPKFGVTLPITGQIYLEVEAENDKAAIDAALSQGGTFDDVLEWETLRVVCEGNVYHGMLNRAYAKKIESDEDEE